MVYCRVHLTTKRYFPKVRAPWPWPGIKLNVARQIWDVLEPEGIQCKVYIEPFLGAGAIFLARPRPQRWEILGDINGLLANAWRALRSHPDKLADLCVNAPVVTVDVMATARWLNVNEEDLTRQLMEDPEWCDVRAAAWWIICVSATISQKTKITSVGEVHKTPSGQGVDSRQTVRDWRKVFASLSERLQGVRIRTGDFMKMLAPNQLYAKSQRKNPTAVVLDPPYAGSSSMYDKIDGNAAKRCEEWCRQVEDNELVRVVLFGHQDDYDLPGWSVVTWNRSHGGRMSSSDKKVEAIWFSPSIGPVTTDGSQLIQHRQL